jgi:hypothetical protein
VVAIDRKFQNKKGSKGERRKQQRYISELVVEMHGEEHIEE